ncbi:hypothetical protein BVX99_02125 [bacterium F16]|nr:hypothetical protein BVX99_02125 [bacterium F16]
MFGKPVIIAGESAYTNCGLTYDAYTHYSYQKFLDNISEIPLLTEDQKKLTRKLFYSYFIERQIPLVFMNTSDGRFSSFDWNKLGLLIPGEDPVVDMICERFFIGDDFILPADVIDYYEKNGLLK